MIMIMMIMMMMMIGWIETSGVCEVIIHKISVRWNTGYVCVIFCTTGFIESNKFNYRVSQLFLTITTFLYFQKLEKRPYL